MEDINEETIEELKDYINCSSSSLTPIPSIPKSHSLAVMTPLPDEEEEADDSKYEGILMTNIKLWKCSQMKSSLKTWWLCVCFVLFVSHRSLIYYMCHVHKSDFVFYRKNFTILVLKSACLVYRKWSTCYQLSLTWHVNLCKFHWRSCRLSCTRCLLQM